MNKTPTKTTEARIINSRKKAKYGEWVYVTQCDEHPNFDGWYCSTNHNDETMQEAVKRHNEDHHTKN